MKKNIIAILAVLGMFGFVSCDADNDGEVFESMDQQQQTFEDGTLQDDEGILEQDEEILDEDQQMQEEGILEDEEGALQDEEGVIQEGDQGY